MTCGRTVYLTVYLFLIARTLKGQVFSVQDLSKASKLVSEKFCINNFRSSLLICQLVLTRYVPVWESVAPTFRM